MPYAGNFLRLSFRGRLGAAGAEADEWVCGLSSIAPLEGMPDTKFELGAIADSIKPSVETFIAGSCSSQAVLDAVRVSAVGTDGKELRDANGAYLHADSLSVQRGSLTGYKPFQVAWVVSTVTEFAGATGRGRFYVPVPGVAVQTNGKPVAANVAAMADRAKALLDAINALHAGFTLTLAVASKGSAVQGIPPGFRRITGLRVGDMFDTQTRRRNDEDEAYEARTVGAGAAV